MADGTPEPLATKYLGATAKGYDDERAGSARRKAELAALDDFFARLDVATMLDIPCGTGALFDSYLRHGKHTLLGIDVSEDMLAEAAATEAGRSGSVTLRQGSVFDAELLASLDPVDLVTCIRFLNWISRDQAEQVLRSLRPLALRSMVVGVSLAPSGRSLPAQVKGRLIVARRARRDRRRKTVTPTVHPEAWFRSTIADLGLTVVDSRLTYTDGARENHLFLLDATG